jgi:RHS repeat-associated protein
MKKRGLENCKAEMTQKTGFPIGSGMTENKYDSRGRKTEEKDVLSPTEAYATQFVYDATGNVLSQIDKESNSTTYVYDELNRKIKVIDSLSNNTEYTYNDRDNLISLKDANGNVTQFEYDRDNRLIKETRPMSEITSYQYDGNGNLTQKIDAKNQKIEYEYDDSGRMIEIKNFSATDYVNPVKTVNFTYDKAGNLKTYNDGTTSAGYLYDKERERTVSGLDMRHLKIVYEYNNNGNMTSKTDQSGTTTYTYDAGNRLIQLVTPNSQLITYYYDPFGRRLWKDVKGNRTYYLYADEGLIGEYDTSGNESKTYGYAPNSTWTTNPLFQKIGTNYYWYQNDHLGTPQKIIDTSGRTVWSATYTAFGEAVVDPSSIIINNLRFAGQYYDAETGKHYNWNRYYDPKTGTYISEDPIGFEGGDVNLMAYVLNNPINYIDPLGLFTWKGWAGVIVGGVGIVTRNPALIIAGGALTIWDWYDSIQEANKKGKELAKQYEKLKKPEQDRIKELMGEEYPSNKPKKSPQEGCKNGK